MSRQPIFLIGYMGCGKSTLGRTVARLTGVETIDLDAYVENRFHRSVSELFALHGEKGYREIERRMLHEVAEFTDVIVACGGGTPCYADNMEFMNSRGTTVFLNAAIPVLHSRLCRGRMKRPLIAGKSDDELMEFIVKSLEQRLPFYTKASVHFSTTELETESEKEATARRFIRQFNLPLR